MESQKLKSNANSKKGENNLLSKRFGLCMKQETNFCISIRNAEIETVRKYIEEQG
jgi:REP element-mobilizing transposase RayT